MPRKPINSNQSIVNKVVEAGQDLVQRTQESKQRVGASVPLPGGRYADFDELIGTTFRPERLESAWADPQKHLKAPRKDCMYVWKAVKGDRYQAMLHNGIRQGHYRPVEVDELIDDVDLPVTSSTLKGLDTSSGSVNAVRVMDLILVELSPEAVRREYKMREYHAAMRTLPQNVRSQVESTMNTGVGGQLVERGLLGVEAEEQQYRGE